MRWTSNTYDPSRSDAPFTVARLPGQSMTEAWQSLLDWLAGKTIGEPQATDSYSVEQLKTMGMVGVYAPDSSECRPH